MTAEANANFHPVAGRSYPPFVRLILDARLKWLLRRNPIPNRVALSYSTARAACRFLNPEKAFSDRTLDAKLVKGRCMIFGMVIVPINGNDPRPAFRVWHEK